MAPDPDLVPEVSATLPSIGAVLEIGELRIQQLLQTIGWSYYAIWLQTLEGGLSWCYGHNRRDKAYNPLMLSALQQYSCCTFSLGMGFEGAALFHGRHQWVSGTNLLRSTVPKQARFFRDACIQTVLCIPYSSGVLELGTTDAVQEDHELVWSIRRFLSPIAGPALLDVHAIEGPVPQGIRRQISVPRTGSEELPYKSDTGSSNSNSSHSEFSHPASSNNVLSPGLSTPTTIGEYGFEIFEQLDMDRLTVTRTLNELPTADMAFRFCTALSSSLVEAPSTVSLNREHHRTSMTGSATQELSNIQINDHTMIPMDLEFGPSSGSLQTELQLLPANADFAREIHGVSSFQTVLDSILTAPNPAYNQNSPKNFDSRRVRNFYGEASNSTTAFKTWTAPALTSQSGKEKIVVAESLWRRWLRYVVPQMKSRTPSSAILPIGSHHAVLAARQHMMAERTRRGKQNECFRTLRNLTPNLRKKDKVAVLEHTIQYVQRLKKQVEELQEQKCQHQYAFAAHLSPETGEAVSSFSLRQNTAQIAASGSVSSELQRIAVNYDASNERPHFQIEIDVTCQAEASDTLINVLAALKQMKLNSVRVDARYERNTLRANLWASHEDDGNTIPHTDKIRELLRSVL